MAESTINMSLKQFNKLMIQEFGVKNLNHCWSVVENERVIMLDEVSQECFAS
jgi:hypothetical protein